jgi:gamma-glutamylaminecyclotransferase
MCIIIIKNNQKLIKTETLMASAHKNPDGLGILWLDKWNITTHRSDEYMILKTQRPYIAHFRYATVGKVSKANCHPFNIDKDHVLFQNGTIKGLGSKKKTDTQHMAEILSDVKQTRWRELLEMHNCRFVTANLKKRKYKIYNKADWITKNDIMYSKDNVLGMTLLGVYGTLKKGYSNYWAHLDQATYLGKGYTVEKYPMVIDGIPFMIDRPGDGHNVEIDLFLVNQIDLSSVDMLEGHPNWYERKRVEVECDGKIYTPYIYFNDTRDTGIYHDTYTETPVDTNPYGYSWKGYEYSHYDSLPEYCSCENPSFIRDWDEEYCDICYGERRHNFKLD